MSLEGLLTEVELIKSLRGNKRTDGISFQFLQMQIKDFNWIQVSAKQLFSFPFCSVGHWSPFYIKIFLLFYFVSLISEWPNRIQENWGNLLFWTTSPMAWPLAHAFWEQQSKNVTSFISAFRYLINVATAKFSLRLEK